MKVAVTTLGKFHHFDLARQLQRADALAAIFTTYPRFKLRNERLPEEIIHPHALWGMAEQVAMRLRTPRLLHGVDWVKIQDIDRYAARNLPDCDAYVAIASAGLESGAEAQRRGAVFVCDRPCTHVRHQNEILMEEYPLYGHRFPGIDPRVMDRQEIEYKRADAVLVATKFAVSTFVERGFAPEKMKRALYGVDLEDFYPDGTRDSDAFDVIFVGALSIRKGIRYLLEAFERFDHPNKRLTLVGSPQPETADLVARAVATGRVVAIGTVPRSEVRQRMSRSHALVLPSVEDGMGLVQPQAMACGCPVISTRNTGCEEIFEDGVSGFAVEMRDPKAIADRLQRLADEPNLHARMSTAAIERVKETGGWDAYGDAVLGHLRDLVSAKRGGPVPAR